MSMTIDKQNGDIAFNDQNHRYWNVNDPSKKFVSVTTLIEKFAQPFDKDFWSAYKALEKLIPSEAWKIEKKSLLNTKRFNKELLNAYDITENDFNRTQQEILDNWAEENRKSCERGTKIHAQLENEFYSAGKNVNLQKFGLGGKFECRKNYTALDLPYGVYPEYLIHRTSEDGILNIAGQIDLLIKNGNEIVIGDHKGLPLDTPILTSKGWSTMENLKVGDQVFDKNGNLCNITVKSAVHNNPCYKIKFDNAESIICDIDHRWLISFKLQKPTKKNPDGYKHQVMTTVELKTYLDSIESNRQTYNIPKILNAKPLNISKSKLPLDPYVLGAWLGDGSSSCGIITQATNSPLWEELKSRGYEIGENLNHNPDRVGTDMRTVFNIRGILDSLGVLNNKHIPDIYLLASYEDRLDLLRGLMDTDGYFHPKRKRFVMTTSFDWQMRGMQQLLSSLGCKVSIFREIHKYDGKEFPGWNINFTTTKFNPFLIRNQEIEISTKDNNSFRNIEAVEEVETVPTQCIAVDSPSHTYLCGHSLIVTHNTNKKIDLKSAYNPTTKSTVKMLYPLNHLDDTNFNHYQLQLSTYAWMLQKINPDFVIKDLILNHYDHEGNNTLYHCDYLKKEVEYMLAFYKKQLIKEAQRAKRQPIEY